MLLSCRNHYCDVTSSLWRRARSHVTCLANERSALTRSTYTQWRHGQAEQKLGTATETQTTGDVSRSNQEREACGRPNARPIYDVTISCNMGISSPMCVYWRHVQVTWRAEPLYMRIHNVSVSGRVSTMYIVEGGGEWRREDCVCRSCDTGDPRIIGDGGHVPRIYDSVVTYHVRLYNTQHIRSSNNDCHLLFSDGSEKSFLILNPIM